MASPPGSAGNAVGAVPARPLQPADPALTEAHYELLRRAAAARRPVRHAAVTARASAATILVIGVLALPFAVLSLLTASGWFFLVIVLGVCAVGLCEFAGARRMRQGEPSAAVFLARNQLLFLALIIAYCVVRMVSFSAAGLDSSSAMWGLLAQSAQSSELEQNVEPLVSLAVYLVYSLVILLSIGFQGGLALYYFSRRRHLAALQAETPPWIRRVLAEIDA